MIQLGVGPFLVLAIETQIGLDLPRGIGLALIAYAERTRRGEQLLAPPQWAKETEPVTLVKLTVAPATERLLIAEATRQHITLAQLAAHAVFLDLAERDRQDCSGQLLSSS